MLDLEAIGLQPVLAGPDGPPLDEEESVLHKFERLQLVIGATMDQGEGTLFITEGRIIWVGPEQRGHAVAFQTVAMHAVVSDGESAPRPCLYLQLDNGEEEEEGGVMGLGAAAADGSEGEAEGEEEEEQEELPHELRLIPADTTQVEALFQAFCEGAERNPDDFSDDDEAGGGGFFYDEDAALAGIASAALGVGDVDELVGADPSRFDDADEEEGDDDAGYEEHGGAGSAPHANGGC